MAGRRPEGGVRDFVAVGGATAVGVGRLAGRLAATVTRTRGRLPAAAAFASSPAVGCLPEGMKPERSLALRAAVALGMSALVLCPMSLDGALAAPAPSAVASGQALTGDAAEARARAHAIMSAFTPLTQRMAEEIHPDILQVMALARKRSGIDFEVVPGTGGKRTLQMQRELVARGASKTMTSRHTTGLALDIVPTKAFGAVKVPNFFDKPTYLRVDAAMRAAAAELGVPITSGVDFKGFVDLGHYELEKHHYAAYSPGDATARTVVATNGASTRSPAAWVTVATGSSPGVAAASTTPGSTAGSASTPASDATPSATPSAVATRRAPPRGVPDEPAVGSLRQSVDAHDEPYAPRV